MLAVWVEAPWSRKIGSVICRLPGCKRVVESDKWSIGIGAPALVYEVMDYWQGLKPLQSPQANEYGGLRQMNMEASDALHAVSCLASMYNLRTGLDMRPRMAPMAFLP